MTEPNKEIIQLGEIKISKDNFIIPVKALQTGSHSFMTTYDGAYQYVQFPATEGEEMIIPAWLHPNQDYTCKVYCPDNKVMGIYQFKTQSVKTDNNHSNNTPNKELPKEVVENITQEMSNDYGAHIQEGGKPFDLSKQIEDRLKEEYLHYIIYYAPIIEDLKQKYDQSDREADHWESKYIMSDAKVQAQAEQLSEKDKRIAELEARNINLNLINASQDIEILQFKQELKKVMGLLKDVYIQSITDFRESRDVNYEDLPTPNELFKAYCKENGIDLGGE